MATNPLRAIEDDLRHAERADGPQATEPVDYAAINAVYAALLAGVVYATRRRAREDPITTRELIPLSAATFALSKVIARERVGTWVREPFVEEDGGPPRPAGRPLRRAGGELRTGTRFIGAWGG